jgi:hypothetical protein
MKSIRVTFALLLLSVIAFAGQSANGNSWAQSCVEPPEGLVSWWPGDGDAEDLAGQNDGTLENGATFAPGMVGQAFSFDGFDDIVRAAATGFPTGTAPRTVAFWAKTDPSASEATGFGYGGEATGRGFYIFTADDDNGGRLSFSGHGGAYDLFSSSAPDLRDNQYHHVAATYDGTTVTLYADGEPVAAGSFSLDTGISGGACIGGRCPLHEFLTGDVDEVAVWSRVLSTSEIQGIFDAGGAGMCKPMGVLMVPIDIKPGSCPNPLNMDGTGVLPVAIMGTDELDVTQIDPASIALEGVSPLRWSLEDAGFPYEPFTGKEMPYDCIEYHPHEHGVFDGIYDLSLKFKAQEVVAALGEIHDGDVLVLQLTGELKEEFGGTTLVGEDVVVIIKKLGRIKIDSVPGGTALAFDGIDDQLNMGNSDTLMLTDTDFTVEAWMLSTSTACGWILGKHDAGWANGYGLMINHQDCAPNKACFDIAGDHLAAISTSDVNDGQWHHIAGVYDASGTKRIYVDGIMEASSPAPVPIPPNTDPFRVGYLYDDHSREQFQGQIDEVRVWNVARTGAEIQSTMDTPLTGNEPGLVGYWKFDEGSGQTAYDSTVNGNNGQLGSTPGIDPDDPSWFLVAPK